MKLLKVLNNSALIVEDEGIEKIVLGRGIGFGLSSGDEVNKAKVDRIFSVDSENEKSRLIELIKEIPDACLEISEEIIAYAQAILKKEISDSIYITLTDHINFILERCKKQLLPSNPLKYDVQRFYTKEYHIGKKAVELLEDEFDIILNDDEAASIAMHIVNAELDTNMYTGTEVIKLIDNIMQVIRYQLKIDFDKESMNYQRLITHLKFFVQRVVCRDQYEDQNPLYDIVKANYPQAYDCILRIKELIEKTYDYQISQDECTYLMIHIQRLLSR